MAIYGLGSTWGSIEKKEDFFKKKQAVIGWDKNNAYDLYSLISTIKVGDIIYLKANKPGSRIIRIKGIGIVTKDFVGCITTEEYNSSVINKWNSLFLKVDWLIKEEFIITIPKNEGKLTNIRAATLYEEFLPYIKNEIINKITEKFNQ